jgi:hypothetical protein
VAFSGMAFSRDGEHLCTIVQRVGKHVVLVDGDVTGTFDHAVDPVFAEDGRLAFHAGDGEREFVVVDGTAGPSFDRALHIRFGAGGGPLTYVALSGTKSYVVVDHVAGPALDGIRSWSLPGAFESVDYVLSPDGTHVACVGLLDGATRPVVDQELGPRYEAIGPPVFTSTGFTFAAARDGGVHQVTASDTDRPA